MWEAFLLQMNDFDSFLELELRDMLDPITERRPPARRGRRRPVLSIEPVAPEVGMEGLPGEPAAVPVRAASAL